MKFAKLVVHSFQAIQGAEIDFGPGLNVLYEPNDLGKSTLAAAARAALLVLPSSSEAMRFSPWHADATPRVSLTFVDDAGNSWKITKSFGGSANANAQLHYSKDGTTFVLDCKGRQVEERIRNLLGWGIPAPGGKGSPRGLPSSFLSNVLLASQTNVDRILGDSLADDPDGSGKVRLTKALATLAQDPVFKKVLDAAQREVDLCFTPTGQRRRGQGAKFTEAGRTVKKRQEELSSLEQQLEESAAIEEDLNGCRERHSAALVRVDEATRNHAAARRWLASTQVRQEARSRLEEARAAVGAIEVLAGRIRVLDSEVEILRTREVAGAEELANATRIVDSKQGELRAAEDAHRVATSDDVARTLELRRAQLSEQAAALSARRQTLENHRDKVMLVIKARADAAKARSTAKSREADLENHRAQLATSSVFLAT